MALQIPQYNQIFRVAKYRRKHGHFGDPSDPDESSVDPVCASKTLNVSDEGYTSGHKVTAYKQKQKRMSDDEIRQVIERYNAGSNTYELAEEFGVHRTTICRALRKNDVKVRNKSKS